MVKAKHSPQYNPDLSGLQYATLTLRQMRSLTTVKQLGGRFSFEPGSLNLMLNRLEKKMFEKLKKLLNYC